MFPKPRRLSEGVFKLRTTASGTSPTDEDLFHTLSEGLPGSRMPEFQRLPEETRWQLVYYVKSLSSAFTDSPPEPIALGKDPGPGHADLARGKELYTQLGCNACHGALGRADGPSAPTLVDQWAEPIRPADLTHGWEYRGGASAQEILTRLMTGLDGTPMPSYVEATTPAEAWHLAYYVKSLQETPRWSRKIEAAPAEGALPMDPQDPQWEKVPQFDLRLAGSFITAASVKALYKEGAVSFRLSWHDPKENRELPADAAAIVILPDRRLKWTFGSLRVWPAANDLPLVDLTYWAAGWESARQATAGSVTDLADHPSAGQPLETRSSFSDGEWVLVVKRPWPSADEPIRLGLLVFDGGNGEQGRRRANSNWVDLRRKP